MSTVCTRRARAAGFSLIELLVSMVIALVVTLAITSVLVRSEGSKRSTTSINDVSQTGTYIAYVLDRSIRSAGSGFAQRWPDTFGCVIDAVKSGTTILPLTGALPVPFANVPLRVRLAPVLIGKGLANSGGEVRGDILSVMGSMAGGGDAPQAVRVVAGTTLRIASTLGYRDNDVLLLADRGVGAGCLMEQVAGAGVAGDQLTFTGASYSRAVGSLVSLTAYTPTSIAIQLGNVPTAAGTVPNPPQMLLYGVGADSTLFSYDLFHTTTAANDTTATPLADGVVELRALYGIDNNPATAPDGVIDTWVDPVAGSGYSMAELTDGSPAAQQRMRQIIAVRVGLIMRTSLRERDAIPAATTLTLFGDLPAAVQQTRVLAGEELFYRFRTVELTVPLRNTLYAPATSTP